MTLTVTFAIKHAVIAQLREGAKPGFSSYGWADRLARDEYVPSYMEEDIAYDLGITENSEPRFIEKATGSKPFDVYYNPRKQKHAMGFGGHHTSVTTAFALLNLSRAGAAFNFMPIAQAMARKLRKKQQLTREELHLLWAAKETPTTCHLIGYSDEKDIALTEFQQLPNGCRVIDCSENGIVRELVVPAGRISGSIKAEIFNLAPDAYERIRQRRTSR